MKVPKKNILKSSQKIDFGINFNLPNLSKIGEPSKTMLKLNLGGGSKKEQTKPCLSKEREAPRYVRVEPACNPKQKNVKLGCAWLGFGTDFKSWYSSDPLPMSNPAVSKGQHSPPKASKAQQRKLYLAWIAFPQTPLPCLVQQGSAKFSKA